MLPEKVLVIQLLKRHNVPANYSVGGLALFKVEVKSELPAPSLAETKSPNTLRDGGLLLLFDRNHLEPDSTMSALSVFVAYDSWCITIGSQATDSLHRCRSRRGTFDVVTKFAVLLEVRVSEHGDLVTSFIQQPATSRDVYAVEPISIKLTDKAVNLFGSEVRSQYRIYEAIVHEEKERTAIGCPVNDIFVFWIVYQGEKFLNISACGKSASTGLGPWAGCR